MKTINICYIAVPELYASITQNYIENPELWYIIQVWTDSDTFYIHSKNDLEAILEKQSPDMITRIIYISIWKLHIASHIHTWDIILPNTFLSKKSWQALYVEYAVGENFDLEKFVLHLDGVCADAFWEVSEEYDGDIEEADVFDFLYFLESRWLKDTAVVILGTDESSESYERIWAIIDMMCSD